MFLIIRLPFFISTNHPKIILLPRCICPLFSPSRPLFFLYPYSQPQIPLPNLPSTLHQYLPAGLNNEISGQRSSSGRARILVATTVTIGSSPASRVTTPLVAVVITLWLALTVLRGVIQTAAKSKLRLETEEEIS
ncbi:hypothetical protein N431DRAFT_75164 [Stipitochalara longipes BDJ]|nr:hypothetical protein N431DRAFT_75164 [Stipitochalara longipes BDJ]